MTPSRVFHAALLSVFSIVASLALLHIPALLKARGYEFNVTPYLISAIVPLFASSRLISDFLLERLPPIRRLLAGRRHIEGDWPLVVVSETDGKMIFYGFLSIVFEGGQYVVRGDDWLPDGTYAMDFESVQSHQIGSTLHYWYIQKDNQQRGYTFMEFFPIDRTPERHTGAFHDKVNRDVRFYARKMKYGSFEKRLRQPEDRRKAAAAFAEEIKPKLPKLHGTRYKFDWG